MKTFLQRHLATFAPRYTASRTQYENFKATFRFAVEDEHTPVPIRLQAFLAARSSLQRFYEEVYAIGAEMAEALIAPLKNPDFAASDIVPETRALILELHAGFRGLNKDLFKSPFAFRAPPEWATELNLGTAPRRQREPLSPEDSNRPWAIIP
jgi:hypothetical protein